DAGEHRGARRAEIALGEKQLGGVGDLAQPAPRHLEHADLVGRPETVLDRAQDAELVRAFAFEGEYRVDHMFYHAGPGDLTVFGDVADEDHGRTRALGEADQRLRARAHLRDRARSGLDHLGPHRLDGIDDREPRARAFAERRHDV